MPTTTTRASTASSSRRPRGLRVIRLGRIGYVNMAPVFHRLDADVEEVVGVPTELNRALLADEIDVAPISSIEYARNADRLRLLPRLCVSSEGAVDSIQLVSRSRSKRSARRGHAGVRDLGGADAGAAAARRARPAGRARRREAADRRRRAQVRLRGPDAALRPGPPLDGPHRAADGVRRLGGPRAGRGRDRRAPGRARRLAPAGAQDPETLAFEASERYGYPAGFLARYFEKLRYRFGPRERAGLYTFLELARDAECSTRCRSSASSTG